MQPIRIPENTRNVILVTNFILTLVSAMRWPTPPPRRQFEPCMVPTMGLPINLYKFVDGRVRHVDSTWSAINCRSGG